MTLSDALPTIEWDLVASHFLRLLVAYGLAVPVAWERERHSRGAGLRTFPLTAMGSCGFVLIGIDVLEGSEALARVFYGLMTGIGFIGGGAILKQEENGSVRGTATAASIWNTGAIGAAVAFGRWEIGVLLSVMNFATLRFLVPFKTRPEDQAERAAVAAEPAAGAAEGAAGAADSAAGSRGRSGAYGVGASR